MKKILVPTDFSDISANAARFAINLAKKMDAQITLFHCFQFDFYHDYQMGGRSVLQTLEEKARVSAEKELDNFLSKFKSKVKIEKRINSNSLVAGIKEMVEQEQFDLVVAGTHGSSGLEEFFIGSNAERVVRHSPCPVISVPQNSEFKKIKKILVPIDLREIRSSFLNQISGLQKLFNCELEFIWVKTPHNIENEEKVGKELVQVMKAHEIVNYNFYVVNNIFPSDGIFLEASESNADMVAMATHARRGISHWLSGSMTEDTVNHIDIPVWSFRIEKKEKPLKLSSVIKAHGKPEYRKLNVKTAT